MKGSLQFEGVRAGGDGYSSGFGVVAEPDTTLTELTGAWLRAIEHTLRLDEAGQGLVSRASKGCMSHLKSMCALEP
jgi:protein phosphatase 1K